MKDFKTFDEVAVYIMNKFSEIFKNHAILKGGMVFKLLGSSRFTNDLDYVFVPYKSKKDVKDDILNALEEIFHKKVKADIHSKCIRYYIDVDNIKIQIEVNVDLHCKSIDLSTSSLAKENNLSGRIIRAMSYDHAISHKLAAWNERGLLRDLYDVYFLYEILNEKPDIEILKKRLSKIESMKKKNKKKSMSLEEFLAKLEIRINQLTHGEIENELKDYFAGDELIGLDKKLKIGIKKLISYLQERRS